MSVLDKLEVVPATERVIGYDPVRTRRKKLAAALQEQLNLLVSGNGDGYRRLRVQRKRDLETDEVFEVEHRRRVVPWWVVDEAGHVRFALRYGSVTLKLRGDDGVIVVSTLEALRTLIPTLIEETLQGALDLPLSAAATELMTRFKRQPVEGRSRKT